MAQTSRIAWIAGGIVALALCAFGFALSPTKTAPAPRAGFVDLSHWNFARDGNARLAGEWLFFENRWVNDTRGAGVRAPVPNPWPASAAGESRNANGFGTYTLTLKLPAASQDDPFAIDTGQLYSAYRLYADGRLVARGGTPAAMANNERANSYSSLGILSRASRTVRLELEVSNHLNHYGGFFAAASVGLSSALEQQRRVDRMVALIVVGALIFAACYHFAFNGIARGGKADLWFGTLAAMMALRNLMIEPLARWVVPAIGQDWVWRLDVASTALSLLAAYWFLALSFRRYLSAKFGAGLTVLCVAAALVSIGNGPAIGDTILKCVELAAGVVIVYLTQGILRSAWDNDKGARLALLGWLIVSAGIVHDSLIDNQVIGGGNVLPFACIAFFLCLSGALTARSHAAFEKITNLSAELKGTNAHLEAQVDARTKELRQKILELETHQIALEESRAAAVSASETKSRFLANMSHELRTPLNAILGYSEIIETRLFGDQTERYANYAADIHASGRHLLALINDILDLSKIEAGKLELVDANLDLDAQIVSALRLLDARARDKSIRLVFSPEAPLRIVADARAVDQILINLLTNAVKFSRDGGTVTVSTHREPDGAIVVAIEDAGIGIKPADMERVLESFGQGRHDIAMRERGTGLGLPIVKGLIEAHGGTFKLESTVDVGTKASVAFPPERALDMQGRERAA